MIKINRTAPPLCLDSSMEEYKNKIIEYYDNLRDPSGKIRDRWNSLDLDNGVSGIRRSLYAMSHGHCAYCGASIDSILAMDVDHYIPKSKAPYLSYCWDNLIPSCNICNQRLKQSFFPDSFASIELIDPCYHEKTNSGIRYDKSQILNDSSHNDRIVDPTFDDPDDHLIFLPEILMYTSKSSIGKKTIEVMFRRHREIVDKWKELSQLMKAAVIKNLSDEFVEQIIKSCGYENVCHRCYEYWTTQKTRGFLQH